MIAAGGTAGHVLPALAVADALTARGVFVTFAGSPDRVEAQLVPDAGYELDTFRISGFPRKPTPRAAERALPRRRRAVGVPRDPAPRGGPTSSSAAAATSPGRWCSPPRRCGSRRRCPRPTRTSGSRTASRAPFAKRVFLAYPLPGLDGRKHRVVGRPIPARARRDPEGRGARDLRAAAGRAGAARRGRARGRALAERARRRVVRRGRAGDPAHHRASATTTRCGAA